MKGYYARFDVVRVPRVEDIMKRVGTGRFYACYHHAIGGGYTLEVASETKWNPSCVLVHILEFFGEAMIEAGGVCVENNAAIDPERRNDVWRNSMGYLTFFVR